MTSRIIILVVLESAIVPSSAVRSAAQYADRKAGRTAYLTSMGLDKELRSEQRERREGG